VKIAVTEIPPLTLIALRVLGAAAFLFLVMALRRERLPRDVRTWRMLLLQAFFNSIGAWTILAWGQQFVEAGLASVLNSTSPIFVMLYLLAARHGNRDWLKLIGTVLGLSGVATIVGIESLGGLGDEAFGQIACLIGAALYAAAAVYGRHFGHVSALAAAAGTMIWASAVLAPLALIVDEPWSLRPAASTVGAVIVLAILCTGVALLIYFRLVRTLGSIGVASQSYLRAGFGVFLGVAMLGEEFSATVVLGLTAIIIGVFLINYPRKSLSN
jgi:drug/metabolite transporter (DMT)-like permease